jgi:hypothetical protein
MSQAPNPFHWRGTVTDPDAFVGREREIASLFTRLQTLSCVSVVGERRIGKSSLLYQTSSLARGALGAGCRPVFIDLLSAKHHSLDGLLGALLDGFGEARPLPDGPPAAKLAAFEDAVRAVRAQGRAPVAFLDEFESLGSRKEEFGDDLLESWRSLGNDGQIAFVCSSARSLDEVTKQSGFTSSFYNIFAQMKLDQFTDKEAREFTQRAMRRGKLEAGDDVFILRVGELHPLRLQVCCYHLWEARRSGQVDFGLLQQRARDEIAGMMKS